MPFQRPLQRLKRCNETVVEACELDRTDPSVKTKPTAGCCSIIPCDICVVLTVDGTVYSGTAVWDGVEEWTATLNGKPIVLYWDTPHDCEFIVEYDGVEVYSAKRCPPSPGDDQADCREPAGSVTFDVVIEAVSVSHTLEWFIPPIQSLSRLPKNTERCADHWCGNCDCVCQEICVSVFVDQDPPCLGVLTLEGFNECTDTSLVYFGTVTCQDGDVEITVTITRADEDDEDLGIIAGDCVIVVESTEIDSEGFRSPKTPSAIPGETTHVVTCPNFIFTAAFDNLFIRGSCLGCEECSSELIECGYCIFFAVNVPKPGGFDLIWTQLGGVNCEFTCTCGGANTFQQARPARTPSFFGELAYCACELPRPYNPSDPTEFECNEITL